MEAIIVMVLVSYSKNTQIRIHHEQRHRVRVQEEACVKLEALPVE